MVDWSTPLGQNTLNRLATEQVIWLTTISASGFPQPRLVWFTWDGNSLLIYSTPVAKKLVHIAHNPKVALHFNSDAEGNDFQVILGLAVVEASAPPAHQNSAYLEKYQAGILGLGMSEAEYAVRFRVAIRVQPVRVRGLEPIPEL